LRLAKAYKYFQYAFVIVPRLDTISITFASKSNALPRSVFWESYVWPKKALNSKDHLSLFFWQKHFFITTWLESSFSKKFMMNLKKFEIFYSIINIFSINDTSIFGIGFDCNQCSSSNVYEKVLFKMGVCLKGVFYLNIFKI